MNLPFEIVLLAVAILLVGVLVWTSRARNRRRVAEAGQEEAEKRYRSIFENSLEGLFQTTQSGKFLDANPAMAVMLGYPSAATMMAELTDIGYELYAKQSDRDTFMQRLIRDGEVKESEVELRRKDGSLIWAAINARTVRDAAGKVAYFEGSAADVTERRLLREELIAKNRELREQNRRVEEANRLKSEFLANMSHELRTPLNGIIGFSEIMLDERVGPVSPDHKEFLTDILDSGRHLLQLINDILDISKIEAGRMEFHPARVSLARLVGEVRDVQKSATSKKRISFESEITGMSDVYVDPAKLKQVLYNYTSNALKFSPEGGRVQVRIGPEDNGFFLLEVEDSGIGIKPEDVPRLFVQFKQLDEGVAKKYQGTGLGLALTKRIVEAQGGRVGVKSVAGKGSTFWAVLPRHHANIMEDNSAGTRVFTPSPMENGAARKSGGSVMIVDDDPSALKMMSTVLEKSGYITVCEPTVGSALRTAEREKPLLIVLDLLMPGMDGFEFVERFRKSPNGADVPIIVWTAKDLTDTDIDRLQGLVQAVVSKDRGGPQPLVDEMKHFLANLPR